MTVLFISVGIITAVASNLITCSGHVAPENVSVLNHISFIFPFFYHVIQLLGAAFVLMKQ